MTAETDGESDNFGARFRALRLARFPNETAADFAKRCKVHPTSLSRIEMGHMAPSLPTCRKLAQGLGVSLAQVVGE